MHQGGFATNGVVYLQPLIVLHLGQLEHKFFGFLPRRVEADSDFDTEVDDDFDAVDNFDANVLADSVADVGDVVPNVPSNKIPENSQERCWECYIKYIEQNTCH